MSIAEMKPTLKPGLEPPPDRMAGLTIDPDRLFPVPWFVAWIDGKPEFRCADSAKRVRTLRDRLCWVCGNPLGRFLTFVIGPMCGVNRTTSEPPCHLDCARYSAKNCPFLSRPHMARRENDMPPDSGTPAGFMIERNPAVSLLWTTRSYELFEDGRGGVLIQVGEPTSVEWWSQGRAATRAEVQESINRWAGWRKGSPGSYRRSDPCPAMPACSKCHHDQETLPEKERGVDGRYIH